MPTRGNRIPLDELRAMPVGEIAMLPADQLALLQEDAEAALQAAKHLKDWLEAAIALRYADRAATLRHAEGKDTGTVRFDDGPVTVVADIPKKVDWDQAQLARLVERIRAGGENPADYVDIAYRVPERKYSAWTAPIREAFAAARTVRTGKASYRLAIRTEDSS
jgi:hypothetical protein